MRYCSSAVFDVLKMQATRHRMQDRADIQANIQATVGFVVFMNLYLSGS